ncbi:MAG: ABC transporter permease [Methanomassiliicoccaceae archaeon]|nr:ABC transporter permease [Methanomassiliicoccaceae archaeon]
MNHLLNLTKKEIKELLAPGTIISIVVMVIIFMGVGTLIGGEVENATAPTKIGVVNGDIANDGTVGEWSEFAIDSIYEFYEKTYGITHEEALEYVIMLESSFDDKLAITEEMIDKGLASAFGIPKGFTASINSQETAVIEEYNIFTNSGLLGSATSAVSSTAIPWISTSISYELISKGIGSADAGFLLAPVIGTEDAQYIYINGEIHTGVTPIELSTSIMSQTMMVPIVIMLIIMVIGGMVISSMGGEKENKTLETLLTMPMSRTTIVSGKLLAAAIVGLIYGMAYMVGMSFYIGGVMGSAGGADLQEYGLSIGLTDWILIAVMIFLAIFCALGICMVLGAFTKNYKASQTMMLPISVLAMIPMFITMFTSWSDLPGVMQAVLFAIPFSHPMMVMNNLMFGNMTLVLAGIAYLVVFTVVIILITVRLYKSDILLTGLGGTKAAKMSKAFSRGKKT